MAEQEIARTELEVWRLAHRVGAEFVERIAQEAGLPKTVIAGARMYRDYVEQVLVEAGYSTTAGVQSCNWCPQPSSPDPRAHPDGQRSHLDAGETNPSGGEDRG